MRMEPTSVKMLDELLNGDIDRLSVWECEFLNLLDNQRQRFDLSQKQEEKLSQIWRRVFG